MSRSWKDHSTPRPVTQSLDSQIFRGGTKVVGLSQGGSAVAALNIEFVAKPDEAHKVHSALPLAINGALGELDGFAGSSVMIANHEARLVTVVTLWSGEDRVQRCNDNARWVRALVAPYLDRCLRVQTLAAYGPGATKFSPQTEQACIEMAQVAGLIEEALCPA
ncbi:MAG TPA: hypothetical protein VMI32_13075 [Candidatus Solibacter sp.]|nr:hypothetical protein [Candidatus Solibacter sp.]